MIASTAPVTWFEGWYSTGNFTTIDLIAASTSALNGALLAPAARSLQELHDRRDLAMALLAGIGGGITRDVLLADVPVALTDPAYITPTRRASSFREGEAVESMLIGTA